MEIAEDYQGVWTGIVHDQNRAEDYPCVIDLNGHGGTARYEQVQGLGSGTFQITGPCVLREDYVGPRRGRKIWMLSICLNAANEMECQWRLESGKLQATATLRRSSA